MVWMLCSPSRGPTSLMLTLKLFKGLAMIEVFYKIELNSARKNNL